MAAVVEFFFTPLVLLVINRECHDEFFVNLNFFHGPCLKHTISKALGIGIILGSLLVKVPQIVKVVRANSTQGLSILSFYAELAGFTINFAYNLEKKFPFSTWGETLFMSVQTAILIILCYYYNNKMIGAVLFPAIYSLIVYILTSGLTPLDVLTKIQVGVLPIMYFGKLLQIIENLRNGHTGQLSFLMIFLMFMGCIARVFTTYHETGDTILLTSFVISLLLNGILLFQILFYWNEHPQEKLKKKE